MSASRWFRRIIIHYNENLPKGSTVIGQKEPGEYDGLIKEVIEEMEVTGPALEEYDEMLRRLERLTALRDGNKPQRISYDTLLVVGGNILGILIIVMYEKANVMTTKAFPHLLKTKL